MEVRERRGVLTKVAVDLPVEEGLDVRRVGKELWKGLGRTELGHRRDGEEGEGDEEDDNGSGEADEC